MDWFLYNKDFRYERVVWKYEEQIKFEFLITSSGVVMVMNFTADAQVFMKLKIFYLLSPTLHQQHKKNSVQNLLGVFF